MKTDNNKERVGLGAKTSRLLRRIFASLDSVGHIGYVRGLMSRRVVLTICMLLVTSLLGHMHCLDHGRLQTSSSTESAVIDCSQNSAEHSHDSNSKFQSAQHVGCCHSHGMEVPLTMSASTAPVLFKSQSEMPEFVYRYDFSSRLMRPPRLS